MSKVTICILVDALGWERMQETPFLDALAHCKVPTKTILGYSSAAIPSLVSGAQPDQHGFWNFFYFAPNSSPFRWLRAARYVPAAIIENRLARRLLRRPITRLALRRAGYTGYFNLYNVPYRYLPLFDYSQKRDAFQPNALAVPSIFDYAAKEGIRLGLHYYPTPEGRCVEETIAELKARTNRFFFVYLPELDALQHAVGTQASKVKAKIAWYDEQVNRIHKAAIDNYDDVDLFVFSDHGMTDTIATVDLMRQIRKLDLSYGREYVAIYDSTMARFWFMGKRSEARVRSLLLGSGYGRILSPVELAEFGLQFEDHLYGQLIFLMNPGILIVPSHMGSKPLRGMHGFHPEHPSSFGVFASNRTFAVPPSSILDLAGLVIESLKA